MFVLKSLGKYIWGNSRSPELVQIPYGRLFSVHKDYRECIFNDATASIRRTTAEFQYQLVIQRAYEEGEDELEEDEAEDEQSFLLDESLHLRFDVQKDSIRLMWDNPDFQDGTMYEFVCESGLQDGVASTFEMVALQCMYERKYRQSHSKATLADLEQFSYSIEDDEPEETNITHKIETVKAPIKQVERPASIYEEEDDDEEDEIAALQSIVQQKLTIDDHVEKEHTAPETTTIVEPVEPTQEASEQTVDNDADAEHDDEGEGDSIEGELLGSVQAELHLFDSEEETFMLQDEIVEAGVYDLGNWKYWLWISSGEKTWLSQPVEPEMNPVFSFEHLSFIWNYFDEDGRAFSWLLRFDDQDAMEKFQEVLMRALWETLNQQRWLKIKDDDREYVLDAFNEDEEMEDVEEHASEREEDSSPELMMEDSVAPFGQESESEVSDDEDEIANRKAIRSKKGLSDDEQNSLLAVGYKNDRSYVARGNRIGVFKHTDDNQLKFQTAIENLQTSTGQKVRPKKIMLHNQDSSIVFQDERIPNNLYHMDLERGTIVDEWKVHEDVPVVTFAPDNKFAQMTPEQTLVGISNNSLFRIDPRQRGSKVVNDQFKQYVTRNAFSAAATTEKGYIAVASSKGDIRLFDRIGINAKTALPALGEPIIGVDVTADGNWVLATCKTYLLLIDARIKEGRYAGKLGFERSFSKNSKPKPKRLQLSPQHIAMMQSELQGSTSFTPGKFNTGIEATETTIVSSIGPYLITWNLERVKRGKTDKYKIRRYEAEIKADDFRFGTDRNLIVTLPNDVAMIDKSSLRKPTRESICTPMRNLASKHDIVNAPY
ncbi:Vid27 family protein [Schizosaccharomyces japonicus yFS275]|uniref:Vid27 family protein n=1 Tax=Schizosaccharomyces japonicus (strain yFS275 / FY16936) TaxID=402676 RepID=B6K271_SCHJY|nr:Vid27 family protein [Schizosaccharomyces japonicus yFS275]EEB07252.2 Vid27 family protein [Schizosaccharomyces japonicus yFS275]